KKQYESVLAAAAVADLQECTTMDGHRIQVFANIGRPHEAQEVPQRHLDGVGLFRTEFMFMDAQEPPDLAHQERVYCEVAQTMAGRPLVIRTVDLGGDKMPAFLSAQCRAEVTVCPRGLRFALVVVRDLFQVQLQAILRASAKYHNISVLFPMVIGSYELGQAIELLRAAAGNRPMPSIGAMIETPASLFDLDAILEMVDFLSIGTNDLTQYMLASDRNAVDLFNETTTLHPAVLRAIAQVAEAANRWNKPLAVCGEAAGDPSTACLLVGLGVRQLSMSAVRVARVRYALHSRTLSDMRQLAQNALHTNTPTKVRQLLTDLETAGTPWPSLQA
ncbi:MAG TPA: putative PEP-binding protein, partial [Tepidisphaeraceae bacterium]|nr:putative PEP-binding protein [Tepidisphaeraceae bacterium]